MMAPFLATAVHNLPIPHRDHWSPLSPQLRIKVKNGHLRDTIKDVKDSIPVSREMPLTIERDLSCMESYLEEKKKGFVSTII
jgi:hypothetical protein